MAWRGSAGSGLEIFIIDRLREDDKMIKEKQIEYKTLKGLVENGLRVPHNVAMYKTQK